MSSLPPGDRPGLTHGLSVRESDVVTLIAAGYSNREIAETLFLSVNSVKTYIRCAYHKMGVTRRSQAVLWAVDHGFTHRMGSPFNRSAAGNPRQT